MNIKHLVIYLTFATMAGSLSALGGEAEGSATSATATGGKVTSASGSSVRLAEGKSASAVDTAEMLEELVRITLEQNPELDALEAQLEGLQYKIEQAGAWRDPKLSLAYQNVPVDSFALGEEAMSSVALRLEQTVPFFGKTEEREAVVERSLDAKRWELEEKKNQLSSLVKSTYYRLGLTRQLRKITEGHVELIEQLITAVRIKYEVGRAQQQNLLRLTVLKDRLVDELDDFSRRDRALTAALNTALHRPAGTKISTSEAFDLRGPARSESELLSSASEHRPALKMLASSAEKERAAASLARLEARPDPTFFASYGVRKELPNGAGGRDLVTVGVGLPLPVFYRSRFEARAQEALAQARAVEAKREALLDNIAAELASAYATWQRSADKVKTYTKHLMPDAHKTLDATFSSYQVDRADFISLYDAELELLNFEKTIRTAVVSGLVARARIEMLIGETLK